MSKEQTEKNEDEDKKTNLLEFLKLHITVQVVKKTVKHRIPWLIAISVILSFVFGLSMTPSPNVIKSLMEINATALGFFAMFAIYLYTSYDTRLRTLEIEKERYEIEAKYTYFTKRAKFDALAKQCKSDIKKLSRKRRIASYRIMGAFVCLLFALFVSLMFLGYMNFDINRLNLSYSTEKLILCLILCFLSVGTLMIVWLIYTINRKYVSRTKEDYDDQPQ